MVLPLPARRCIGAGVARSRVVLQLWVVPNRVEVVEVVGSGVLFAGTA